MLTAVLGLLAIPALAGPLSLPLVHLGRDNDEPKLHSQSLTPLETGLGLNMRIGNQDVSVYLSMGQGNGLTLFGSFTGDKCFFRPKDSPTFDRQGSIGCPFDLAFEKIQIGDVCLDNAAFAYADSRYAPAEFGEATGQTGSLSLGLGLNANSGVGSLFPRLVGRLPEPVVGFSLPPAVPDAQHRSRQIGRGNIDLGFTSYDQASAQVVRPVFHGTFNLQPKMRVNGNYVPWEVALADANAQAAWAGRGRSLYARNNDKFLVARPDLSSNVLQISPKLAQSIFALIPGAVATEWQSTRDNDKIASVESSTGVASLERGCSYSVPCNTNSTITVQFDGVDYDMPPKQWVIPNSHSRRDNWEMCKTRVYVPKADSFGDDFNDIVLGAPFLETVYTVLRYGNNSTVAFTKLCV